MFKKLWMPVFMGFLVLNFVGTIFVEYRINKNLSSQAEATKLLIAMELKNKEDNEKFRSNIYKGMALVMQGQSQIVLNQDDLNVGLLRVHHFVQPHSDKFYKNCPECQIEKQEIEKDLIITQNEKIFHSTE